LDLAINIPFFASYVLCECDVIPHDVTVHHSPKIKYSVDNFSFSDSCKLMLILCSIAFFLVLDQR